MFESVCECVYVHYEVKRDGQRIVLACLIACVHVDPCSRMYVVCASVCKSHHAYSDS